ncbi:hypothetical protein ACJJTC_001906 [Scirpophaga incertulas]
MKWICLISLLVVGVVIAADDDLPLAKACDQEACQPPDCRCSSTSIPGGLDPKDTPQFVMVTFDDAVNVLNTETYRNVLYNRRNQNGCPVGATFYVCHEYTNYQLVNELYNNGFEIALHSITHQTPLTYWAEATKEIMLKEFGEQRVMMSHFANIPIDEIQGIRMPFLQMPGNASFEVLAESGMTYDCSWPTITHIDPGLWPYTLDYASTQDCVIAPCPTASIPGKWVIPMISWIDEDGTPCSMVDSCFSSPPQNDATAWFEFIKQNFNRHYQGNRSPFGFFIHEWYLRTYPAVTSALIQFLDYINSIPDVFMVNSKDVIDWVKDPVPINEYKARGCRNQTPSACSPASVCGPLEAPHKEERFYMSSCNACPKVYPWLGDPLGKNEKKINS